MDYSLNISIWIISNVFIVTFLILFDATSGIFAIYIFVRFTVLIVFNVEVIKVSLFETVALMDSLGLSVEQFLFRRRFI